jgi:hypothetical protein
MKSSILTVIILAGVLLISGISTAKAEILGGLSHNEFKIKLFGWPLNLTPALNIELSFSDPEIAKLSTTPPSLKAEGTNLLLSSSDPTSNTVSIVRTGEIIPNQEAEITVKLDPKTVMGATQIRVNKIEAAGGFDITDSVIAQIDPPIITNSNGTVKSELGRFTLIDPGTLTAPGNAAIAFQLEDTPNIISATLNGQQVDFISGTTGIAIIDLPKTKDKSILSLTVNSPGKSKTIHLGDLKIDQGIPVGLPPRIKKAVALNNPGDTQFKLFGRKFGVRRFGKERVAVKVIPTNKATTNNDLKKRKFKERLANKSCIPFGSYVNISHPGGTAAKKIDVVGNCSL